MAWFFLCVAVGIIIFDSILTVQRTNILRRARNINTMHRPSASQIILQFLQHHRTPLTQITRSPLKRKQQNTFFTHENRIELNADFFDSDDIVSISVACHEAGHAATEYNYKKLTKRIRTSLDILSTISVLCLLYSVGSFILLAGYHAMIHCLFGIILAYSLLTICQAHKLFFEWNATRLALEYIKEKHLATTEEFALAKQYLTRCFLTYISAIVTNVAVALTLLLL